MPHGMKSDEEEAMKKVVTMEEALADPTSSIHRKLAHARIVMRENEEVVRRWMALGYTREEAIRAGLFGFRKPS